ncbi:MAG TPA: uroporphyrinogen-III C-methyltransferase [Candidatus Limnocylindrales bacterium]
MSGPGIGSVALVGAGPGDPELITRRGARLLGEADAVVYDRLVAPELVDLAPPSAFRIDVGKEGWHGGFPQRLTSELLVCLGRAGLRVVRLKGGDPLVFGRGGEEMLALRAAGVPVEIVPGVTAAVAGPAAAGFPLTHRGVARTVAFVTATTDEAGDGAGGAPDWHALARIDTLVVFMAGRRAGRVAGDLLAAGKPPNTPVAVIVAATRPDEEIGFVTLGELALGGPCPLDRRPVELVIGDVVGIRQRIPRVPPPRPVRLAPSPRLAGAVGSVHSSPRDSRRTDRLCR